LRSAFECASQQVFVGFGLNVFRGPSRSQPLLIYRTSQGGAAEVDSFCLARSANNQSLVKLSHRRLLLAFLVSYPLTPVHCTPTAGKLHIKGVSTFLRFVHFSIDAGPCCTAVGLFHIRRQLACQRATVNLSNPASDPFTSHLSPVPHTRPIPRSSTTSATDSCLRPSAASLSLSESPRCRTSRSVPTHSLTFLACTTLSIFVTLICRFVCLRQAIALVCRPCRRRSESNPQPRTAKASTRPTHFSHPLFAPSSSLVRSGAHSLLWPSVRVFFPPSPFTASKTSPASCTTDDLVRATHADKPHSISCNRLYAFPSSLPGNRHLLNTVTDQTTQPPQRWVAV
jgi:hypothetical protein